MIHFEENIENSFLLIIKIKEKNTNTSSINKSRFL